MHKGKKGNFNSNEMTWRTLSRSSVYINAKFLVPAYTSLAAWLQWLFCANWYTGILKAQNNPIDLNKKHSPVLPVHFCNCS